MDYISSLKKELEFYRNKFGIGEKNVSIGGYLAYVNIVRQQVDYTKDFDIKANIEGKKSENAMYERTEAIWKSLPSMISSMNSLRIELGIEFDPTDGQVKTGPTTPQSLLKRE